MSGTIAALKALQSKTGLQDPNSIHHVNHVTQKFPSTSLINATTLTDAQLDAKVTKGVDDISTGRMRSVKQVVSDLAREFSL